MQTVDELLQIQDQLDEKLQNITSLDEKIELLEQELQHASQSMFAKAKALSEKRKSAIHALEKELKGLLSYLGIPNAQFIAHLTEKPNPDINGLDHVEFLFSANKNAPPQPVSA